MSGQRPIVSLGVLVGVVVLLLSEQPAQACSVCYGEPGSPMVMGIQAGVLVLLGVVGTVLTGLGSVIIFWVRRASRLGEPPQRIGHLSG